VDDAAVTLIVLAAAVVLFVWNRLPIAVVALAVALALYATGVVSLEQALAGFGDPTVLFIASLFVIAEALDAGGVTTWAGQRLVRAARSEPTRLVAFVLILCAVLSAVITPNGAVAALVPMMVVIATRLGRPPSKLLMPLAFGAHAGSLLVLTGSPVNILVRVRARRPPARGRHRRARAGAGRPAAARPARTLTAAGLHPPRAHAGRALRPAAARGAGGAVRLDRTGRA